MRADRVHGLTNHAMSNMRRKVSAREFLHGFAKLEKELRPGESIMVTRRGEEVGEFVKKDVRVKVGMPESGRMRLGTESTRVWARSCLRDSWRMKRFVDWSFLLTLLLKRNGSEKAWAIAKKVEAPLLVGALQIYTIETRLQRELDSAESSAPERALAANELQNVRRYSKPQVFESVRLDYNIAIDLAYQWQSRARETLPLSSGLKLLPEKL